MALLLSAPTTGTAWGAMSGRPGRFRQFCRYGRGGNREGDRHPPRPREWVFDEGMRSVDGALFGLACPLGRSQEEPGSWLVHPRFSMAIRAGLAHGLINASGA